jgi:gamma-tubulin complex component 3
VALPAGAAARRFLDTYTTHAAAPVTAVGVGGITIGSSVVANPHPTAAANDDAAGSSKKTSGGSNELSQHSQQRQLDDVVFFRECVHSLLGISELQIAQWDAELLAYAPMQTAVQMRKLDGLLAANPGSPQTSELETFTVAPRQAALFNEWVAPCASLRRRLGEYLSRPAASFLQQALRRAVERQLSAYDRFVTSIRCGDAAGPRASGSALASTRRAGDGAASSLGTRAVNSDTELFAVRLEGLAALQVATLKARPKLRALHDVLAALEAAKGGALMSRLQALHRHGGEEIEAMLDDVYRETIAPLLFMTLQWLTKGACTDPFDEFFVSNETAVPEASDKYWTQRHVLRPLMLPASMLSQEQAAKVLAAGKNVNFLQRLCKAREWSLPASILAKARHTTFETIPSLTDECLDASNRAVLATLNDKFRLAEAFERARVVYLLADADFATGVIHRMEDVLSPAVAQRGAARMQAEAQEALVAAITSMGRLLPPCMAGIDTIILAEVADPGAPPGGGGGDASQSQASQQQQQYTGWDTFVMALPFPPPYNVFFSTDTVRQYRRLFRLLWKVRRAEVELKRTWQLYCQVIRGKEEEGLLLAASRRNAAGSRVPSRHPSPESAQADAEFRAGQRELRQASARVFQHLTHFVSNLQMYLVTEVVEAAWLRFRAALARCRAVDDIVRAHAEYLGAMMQYALLREQYGDVKVLVNHVLNLALDFCGRFQRDFVVATSGTTATVAAGVSPQRVTATIRETLRLVDGSVRVLLDRIERDPVTLDFMQALAARLNFNHFYSEPVM